MSVVSPSARLRSPLAAAVLLLALAVGAPAQAASSRSPFTIAGTSAKRLRMCGAAHQTLSTISASRLVVTIRHRARTTRSLAIARRPAGSWHRYRTVRVSARRVRLPRLPAGGYRISGRGVVTGYLRVSGAGGAPEYPLLDPSAVRGAMVAFCGGPGGKGPRKPDSTPLPTDPRTLVNGDLGQTGRAAYFNASWIPVHDAPGFRKTPVQEPTSCGAFRRDASEGETFLHTKQFFQLLVSAKAYDNLWRVWGLKSKPSDFDQEVEERYGLSAAPFRNPYPMPGQDPNATGGGSGQLPLGPGQGQDKTPGKFNGMITITCSSCHDSILGDQSKNLGFHGGRGNPDFDATLFGAEMASAAGMIGESPHPRAVATAAVPYPYSGGRGLTNAFGLLDYLGASFDMETLDASPGVEFFPGHGAAGQVQTPNWWNRSHRTRMFLGGELSGDNTRVSMALAGAPAQRPGAEVKKLEPKFEQVHVYFDSLSPPKYPGKIDKRLAEEGAILFHDKDLWSDARNASIPKPPGNGSCSSCHGVYSPRYAEDKTFLPTARLKGIEANITPIQTIGTDPARTRLVNDQFKRAWNTSWWGFVYLNPKWTKDGQGPSCPTFARLANDYNAQNSRLKGTNVWSNSPIGYEAPPLYGAWASAPYFHNGSVPTVRGVLDPKARPDIWRRPLARPGIGGVAQGFDTTFAGYDFDDLGYRYTRIACDGALVPCHPESSPLSVVEGELSKTLGPSVFLGNQVPPPMSETDRRRRMIYDTHEYSMGNGGHDFMSKLSADDVNALLEFLKTL